MKSRKVKGFTLIELIVVIAIIGVLAAILVPSMMGFVKKSRYDTANANAKSVYNYAQTYATDYYANPMIGDVKKDAPVTTTGTVTSVANEADPAPVKSIETYMNKYMGADANNSQYHVIITNNAPEEAWWRKIADDEICGRYPKPIDADNIGAAADAWPGA